MSIIYGCLSAQVRVLGFTRVTNSFDARKHCDRRRYEYILPASAFDAAACRADSKNNAVSAVGSEQLLGAAERKDGDGAAADGEAVGNDSAAEPCRVSDSAAEGGDLVPRPHAECRTPSQGREGQDISGAGPSALKEDAEVAERAGERAEGSGPEQKCSGEGTALTADIDATASASGQIGPEQIERLNSILRGFEGTHCFHNFTAKVLPTDPAAMRYILSFRCAGTMQLQVRQLSPTLLGFHNN